MTRTLALKFKQLEETRRNKISLSSTQTDEYKYRYGLDIVSVVTLDNNIL